MAVRSSRVSVAIRCRQLFGMILIGLLSATPATAAITVTSNPTTLAAAHSPGSITGASFVALPPAGTPHATANAPLDGFPSDGATFDVPPLANCLSFDFRFLTDEYPE